MEIVDNTKVGVSIVVERGRQQNDRTLAGGWQVRSRQLLAFCRCFYGSEFDDVSLELVAAIGEWAAAANTPAGGRVHSPDSHAGRCRVGLNGNATGERERRRRLFPLQSRRRSAHRLTPRTRGAAAHHSACSKYMLALIT